MYIAIGLTDADVGRFRSVRQLGSFFQNPQPDPHVTPFHPLKHKEKSSEKKKEVKTLAGRWRLRSHSTLQAK